MGLCNLPAFERNNNMSIKKSIDQLIRIIIVLTILVALWIFIVAVIDYLIQTIPLSFEESMEANKAGLITDFSSAKPAFSIEEFIITAYCPCSICCNEFADGITASGHIIKKGDKFIAADKDFLFGYKIYIPDYGYVPVLDRGGAIKGNRFDVYFDTHQEALNWGVVYAYYKVYKERI